MEASDIEAGRTYYEYKCPKTLFMVQRVVGERVVFTTFDHGVGRNLNDDSPDEMPLASFARKMYAEHI